MPSAVAVQTQAGPMRGSPAKAAASAGPPSVVAEVRSSNLGIKRTFTDHERDAFLDASFEYIANFFEGSLAELQNRNQGIKFNFRRINADHFAATIYHSGKSASQCGIRRGGMLLGSQMLFCDDPQSTNSWNESLSVEDDGHNLFLRATGFSRMMTGGGKERLTQQGAAELFWSLLIEPLQR